MGHPEGDIGTKEDLCLYRIQTAKENLKAARILQAVKKQSGRFQWQMNLSSWLKNTACRK